MGISKEQMDLWAPKLAEFKSEPIQWMVNKLIPYGAITLVDGDPGSGKSNLIHWLCASASIGRNWPDGSNIEEQSGLIIDAENNIGRGVRRRIENNGGDVSRFRILNWFQPIPGKPKEIFTLPDHLLYLEEMVAFMEARFIVIDTAFNHLSRSLNANSDQDIRAALTPLSHLAEQRNIAVIILRHLNKAQLGPALYRGSGSVAFNGVARSVLLCAKDPSDPKRKILAHVKTNEAALQQSRSFGIDGQADGSCGLSWGDPVEMDADELLKGVSCESNDNASDRASDELREILSGGEMRMEEVVLAAKRIGISLGTLRRAKAYLKVRSKKNGNGEGAYWMWSLPSDEPFYT